MGTALSKNEHGREKRPIPGRTVDWHRRLAPPEAITAFACTPRYLASPSGGRDPEAATPPDVQTLHPKSASETLDWQAR